MVTEKLNRQDKNKYHAMCATFKHIIFMKWKICLAMKKHEGMLFKACG